MRLLLASALVLTALPVAGTPAAAGGCGAVGSPTTTVFLPNITKTLGGPTGWVTPFIVQNVGTSATTLEVAFYRFGDGSLVTCRSVPGLLPQTSFADVPNNDTDLPDNSQFSVVVRSFGAPVVAVVNEHQGSGSRAEALSYVGVTSGATRVGLPWVAKSLNGWLTTFVIQNVGTGMASVTVGLASEDGTKTATLTRTIPPGRSAVVDPSVEPALAANTSYAALLTADQPIGVIANAHNDAPSVPQPMAFSYNGVPAADGDVLVPWTGRNVDGALYSSVVVQNLGTADANATLTFRRVGGTEQVVRTLGPLAPGKAASYVLPPASVACPGTGSASCPREGEHSLIVSGGPFAVLAYALGPTSAMGITGGPSALSRVYLPNVTRTLGGASGWTTPIVLQSAGATTAALRWFRFVDGALAVTQYVPSLTPGASLRIDPRTVEGLADGTQYAVVVDATGPIRAAVLELSSAGGDGAMAYEGFGGTNTGAVVPTPTALTVAPTSATVTLGATQQFTAVVKDQFGSVLTGVPLSWSVAPTTAGTVTTSGLFTPSGTATTATITVSFGFMRAVATVTVVEQTVVKGGFTFNVRLTATSDVYIEKSISTTDAQTITRTVDADVAAVETTYARAFTKRPPVYVFHSTKTYTTGLVTVVGVPPADVGGLVLESSCLAPVERSPTGRTAKVALNWERVKVQQPVTTIRHELTHAMISQITDDTVENPIPAWLNEGSARLEEFTIAGTGYLRMRNRYAAASMVAVRKHFSLEELTSGDAWNARTGEAGHAQYYESSQVVQLLRDQVGVAGVTRIFDLMGQGQRFDSAFQAVTGRTVTGFAAELPVRLQAMSQWYPYVATAQDVPGGTGLSYIAYGFAPSSTITIDIVGLARGFENTLKTWTVDGYGVLFSYLGSAWPADTYSITVTGAAPPSATIPNAKVRFRVDGVKARSVEALVLTW